MNKTNQAQTANLFAKFADLFKKKADELSAVDPSQMNISDKAVGGKVEIKNEDGTLAPIPDGDYQDADGTPFKVKDGLIVEWNGEKEAAAEMADAPVEPDAQPTEDAENKGFEDLKAAVAALQQETEAIRQIIDALVKADEEEDAKEAKEAAQMAAFSKQLENITTALEAIAVTPAQFSKTNKSTTVKDSQDEKMNEYARAWASLKSK